MSLSTLGTQLELPTFDNHNLMPSHSLRDVFHQIYYHLYSNSNLPRAERLAAEVTRLLFCKIYDESHNTIREFRYEESEDATAVLTRIKSLFSRVRREYPDVFESRETIHLDPRSVVYVVDQLQNYSLLQTDKDSIGDAFEAFMGRGLRGEKGQFFTPRTVVRMMIGVLDPQVGEKILDPACGSGGFLSVALEHLWKQIEECKEKETLTPVQARELKSRIASQDLIGIDKEADMVKLARAYMVIVGDGHGGIFQADSLAKSTWSDQLLDRVSEQTFDVAVTNPPFGARIPITNRAVLAQYDLGHIWTFRKRLNKWMPTAKVAARQDPQILFLERCVRMLRPGGRLGIVLPEGVCGNRKTGYVLDYLRSQGNITGIVDCTRILFQPYTDTKTNVLFFRKSDVSDDGKPQPVFLAVVRRCGHDRRGRPVVQEDGTLDDEFPQVVSNFHASPRGETRLGFCRQPDSLEPYYLVPRYYTPEIERHAYEFQQSRGYNLVSIQELVQEGVIEIRKGHEVGSEAYGTGDIPFVRTSDIANWEIAADPTRSISEKIYEEYRRKQGLQEGDILFVSEGRYRIGRACILTPRDTKIVVQSHVKIIRVKRWEVLNPYVLLYLLKTPFVQEQIEAKTFIQSTIATIGPRINELILPIPNKPDILRDIENKIKRIVVGRAELLAEAQQIDRMYKSGCL